LSDFVSGKPAAYTRSRSRWAWWRYSDEVHFHHLKVDPPRQIGTDLVYTVSQNVLFDSDPAITFPSVMVWNALAGPVWGGGPKWRGRFTVSGNLVRIP
jgi:hypothetical protein